MLALTRVFAPSAVVDGAGGGSPSGQDIATVSIWLDGPIDTVSDVRDTAAHRGVSKLMHPMVLGGEAGGDTRSISGYQAASGMPLYFPSRGAVLIASTR